MPFPLIRMLTGVLSLLVVAGCSLARSAPSPSPDRGERIAFSSDAHGTNDIFVLQRATGTVSQLTAGLHDEWVARWSPDGEQLAFGAANQLWVMGADGSDVRQLTLTPGRWEAFSPSWSPDGARLAFSSESSLYLMPLIASREGAGWTRVTQGVEVTQPQWSPRGDQIAFAAVVDGNTDIYTVSLDGIDIRRLTNDAAADYEPSWSPDGTQLAFVSQRDGNAEIYRMQADGSAQTRITTHPGDDESPGWSPDGQQLAFATERAGNWDIYTIRTNRTEEAAVVATTANETFPTWTR